MTQEPQPDEKTSARLAHLRYVHDSQPGIRRVAGGDSFRYFGPGGAEVTDEASLERIRKLAIPPAYTDVWICRYPNGHLQATGRDARGRKQYRYHERWRQQRDSNKYDRMLAFGAALPKIRARVEEDLAKRGMSKERVLAAVIRLLETTHIRVGNEEYARANDSYGLTTLKNEHVDVSGSTIHFHFRGKSGKDHEIDLSDRRIARIVARCQELPEQELFEYVTEDGTRHDISSGDVNAYLKEITGEEFTAKDFRTWAGTVLCAEYLAAREATESETAKKKALTETVKAVAEQLGNTPAVCRKCYIHPNVPAAYLAGSLSSELVLPEQITPGPPGSTDLTPAEKAVLNFLADS